MEKMKIIDLLNKIVNGELEEDTRFGLDHNYGYQEYLTVRKFFERYIVDKENLELDIIIEEVPKKIEQIGKSYNIRKFQSESQSYYYDMNQLIDMVQDIYEKQREIINKINGE